MAESRAGAPPSEFGAALRWLLATRRRRALAMIFGWTAVGLVSAAHWQLFYQRDSPYSWWELLRIKLLLWYLWGGCTLWILWACRRFRPEGPKALSRALLLFVWSLIQVAAYLAVYAVAIWAHLLYIDFPATLSGMVRFVVDNHSTFYYLAFWATCAMEYALEYARRVRAQELAASRLRAQLSEARWHALQARLQPHFLFNALNTIGSMVREGRSEEAYDVLVRLSELLRESLKKSELREVPLERELEFSGHYLEIARARYPDRLSYKIDLPPGLGAIKVPVLILQPLVENAVVHGLNGSQASLALDISCRVDNGTLALSVRDNGPGLADTFDAAHTEGFGLANIRERLDTLFGDSARLSVQEHGTGGVTARIELPIARRDEAGT